MATIEWRSPASEMAVRQLELAAAVGEDWRPIGQTCSLLLAPVGRRAPESEAVRQHAEDDRGAAVAGRLAN